MQMERPHAESCPYFTLKRSFLYEMPERKKNAFLRAAQNAGGKSKCRR